MHFFRSGAVILFLFCMNLAQADMRAELRTLYPNLSDDQFSEKLKAPKKAFQFFRSFIPYYYKVLADGAVDSTMSPLAHEMGWCAGDPHVENFSALLNAKGKSFFTVNDMDDSGQCPLYADFLRFLTSVVLADTDNDLAPLLKTYRKELGKNHDNYDYSKSIKELLKESEHDGPQHSDKDVKNGRLTRDHDSEELSADEKSAVTNAINAAYSGHGPQIVDLYKTHKDGGGSSGLLRIEVLIHFDTQVDADSHDEKRHQIIELKEEDNPGIFPLETKPLQANAARLLTAIKLEQKNPSALYQARDLAAPISKTMLFRPEWSGNKGVSLDDYGSKKMADVMADEAATLAWLHGQTATAAYLSEMTSDSPHISDSDWINAAKKIAAQMENAFKQL